MFSLFLKRNLKTIMKDIRPIEQLTKDSLQEVDRLEINIYNPNSKFNKTIFRTHKYECKICYINKSFIFIQENSFQALVHRIESNIGKNPDKNI